MAATTAPSEAFAAEATQLALFSALTSFRASDATVRQLLASGASVDALGTYAHPCNPRTVGAAVQPRGRVRPLWLAAQLWPRGDGPYTAAGAVRRLLALGADAGLRNDAGDAPLHGAVARGSRRAVRALVAEGRADVNAAVTAAAADEGGTEKKTFSLYASPFHAEEWRPGWTALHKAASAGSESMVRLLLELGADPSRRDESGATAFDVAVKAKNQGPFWALVEAGAAGDIDDDRVALPEWVFRSEPVDGPAPAVVRHLEKMVLKGSELDGDEQVWPALCGDCQRLKDSNDDGFTKRELRIRRWLGDANFDTPFVKRCTACRRIVKSVGDCGMSDTQPDGVSGGASPEVASPSNMAKDERIKPAGMLYEANTWRDPNGADESIESGLPEELGLVLDHTQSWEDSRTDSDGPFALAAYWLHSCLTGHEECAGGQQLLQPSPLPTRLVRIGKEQRPPRLHVTKGMKGYYCALSYRWDSEHVNVTTKANLSDMLNQIPADTLPPTIRDALRVARTLGLEYIWIDALCIVQDDAADWRAEAAGMAGVYQHALFTIAAVDRAPAAQGGGIFQGRATRKRPLRVAAQPASSSSSGFVDYPRAAFAFAATQHAALRPRGELDTRGWCYQERVLSRRILSYAAGELFWDCLARRASESSPAWDADAIRSYDDLHARGRRQGDRDRQRELRVALGGPPSDGQGGGGSSGRGSFAVYDLLKEAVCEYSALQLTKESDKLAAIEGVGSAAARVLGDSFVAGLWRGRLHDGLLWWVRAEPAAWPDLWKGPAALATRPADFSCPSWSWASVVGRVALDRLHWAGAVRGHAERRLFKPAMNIVDVQAHVRDAAEAPQGVDGRLVAETFVFPAYSDPRNEGIRSMALYGQVRATSEARLVFLSPRAGAPAPAPSSAAVGAVNTTVGNGGVLMPYVVSTPGSAGAESAGLWLPDTTDDSHWHDMFCALVATEEMYQYCVCLTPTGRAKDEYRRIGLCSLDYRHGEIGNKGLGAWDRITIV